jgi:carboxypeptidase Taq
MKNARESYDRLILYQKKTATLESCSSVIGWDRETFMPPTAAPHRAEQLALLSGLSHERRINPEVGEWLSACEDSELAADPLSAEAVNIREIRRVYDKNIKVPPSLVEELTRVASLAHQAWIEAREKSDYKIFRPWLENVIGLKREYGEIVGYKDVLYDAFLDDFEPGESTRNISLVFAALRKDLVPLIEAIVGSRHRPDRSIVKRCYPIEQQRIFGEMAAASIGFDFNAGRLDTVVHPFCSGLGPNDTRITTRWDQNYFNSALFSILHEAGHGLYNQGLPKKHWGTPMGNSVSLGIHESQSRLWENIVGRSRSFWEYFYPKAQAIFAHQLEDVPLDDFLHAVNDVRPSFIRVEADEATYTLHIVLRFDIEQALVSGDLDTRDLPEAWNEKFKALFGKEVPDDANGCLQDVHWSFASFGYFPTYALGNLYAAQFYQQARTDIADLEESFARGDFSLLLDWLRKNIHAQGMRYKAPALIEHVTGEPLNHQHMITSLRQKYTEFYRI